MFSIIKGTISQMVRNVSRKNCQISFLSVDVSFVSLIKLSAHTVTNAVKLLLLLGGLRAVKSQSKKHLNKTMLKQVCIELLVVSLYLCEMHFKKKSFKSKYLTRIFYLFVSPIFSLPLCFLNILCYLNMLRERQCCPSI